MLILGHLPDRHPDRAPERLLRAGRARQRRPRGGGPGRDPDPRDAAGHGRLARLASVAPDQSRPRPARRRARAGAGARPPDVHAEQLEGLWPELRDRLRDLRDQVGGRPAPRRPARTSCASASATPPEWRRRWRRPPRVAKPVFTITGSTSREFETRADGDQIVITLTDAREAGARPAHPAAEPRDHPPPRGRGGHPRALDPAPGRRPRPGAGSGRGLRRGAAADHRPDGAAVLPRRSPTAPPTRTCGRASTRRSCPRWTSRASSTSWTSARW